MDKKLVVVACLDKDEAACCDDGVVAWLGEGVMAYLDKNNNNDFDVGFILAHPFK